MCSSQLCEYCRHACIILQVVVGIGVLDGLNGWVELAPPFFAYCHVDVGDEDEDECKLGDVSGNAIGMHAAGFCSKELNFGADFLVEVELEGDDGIELCKDIAAVGVIGSLHDSCDEVNKLVVINASKIRSNGSLEYSISDIAANFICDGSGSSFFGSNVT